MLCTEFILHNIEISQINDHALSYVHHTKDPRVCPTGSPVQCCPSLSREELYLPTTHTEKENRSFIELCSGQQVKYASARALTKTDMQSRGRGSRGLMKELMNLSVGLETQGNPRLWVRIPALAGSVHDWGETLEQGTEPPTAPRALQCRLPTAPGVCALGWVKCREHISLLIILCIIVYVTNKAHLSLICNLYLYHMRHANLFHTSYCLASTHQTLTHQHILAKRLKHTSTFKWPKALFSSDAPIMIFRGRFRYRFFSSKLADSDSDFFPFKQPTRNNERF